jgi:carboxypeptidase PM20D1
VADLGELALRNWLMLKRVTITIVGVVLLLVVVLVLNAYRQGSRQLEVPPVELVAVDANAAAERLAGAVRLRTVSYDGKSGVSAAEFRKLHTYLEQQYPRAHGVLNREIVADLSLLYTWEGTDPAAKPIVLMAHQDVVPIAPGTEKDWQFDPFAGAIHDGFVWGRGGWDDKGNLLAIMEAVELLVAQGFKPRQRIYLAFGHDEEVGGELGAKQIAGLLESRAVKADFVLDEDLLITNGILKGLDKPVALVGIAEKGQDIARTVRELFPGTLVAPSLMIGATDSRHMREITDHILRFSPVRATAEDLQRFHGTNERMSLKNYAELIAFYHRLLTNAAKPSNR